MRPLCLQGQAQVVAALAVVLGDQLLVEVLGGEVPVAGVEQLKHPHHFVHRRAPGRDPAQAAVVETLRALRLVAIAPAPKVRSDTPSTSAASAWLNSRDLVRPYTSSNFINLSPCACSVRRIQTLHGLDAF